MSDIVFDHPNNGQIDVLCNSLLIQGSDVLVDSAGRRKRQGGLRRALVHDQADGLTLNYNGDYPGGVSILGKVKIVISHIAHPVLGRREPDEVVVLQDVIQTLRTQIADLQAQVNALKAQH